MTLNTIKELLAREPLEPFRIVTSSGDRYLARRPNLIFRVKNGFYVGVGGRGVVADKAAYISTLHTSAVEMDASGPPNGHGKRNQRQALRITRTSFGIAGLGENGGATERGGRAVDVHTTFKHVSENTCMVDPEKLRHPTRDQTPAGCK